jgi:hypothetical protein
VKDLLTFFIAGLAVAVVTSCSTSSAAEARTTETQFRTLGHVTGDFEFKSDLTNTVWVDATRGFNAGSCGYLGSSATATLVADKFTIPDKAWVRWRFKNQKEFRTNAVDVSGLPKGNHKGVLSITLKTNLAWAASFRTKP